MIGLLAHLFIMALSPKCLIAPIISIYSNINLDSFDIIPGAKKPEKQSNLAVRWILALAKEKQKKAKTLKNRRYGIEFFLAQEIVFAYKNESELKQKKIEIHKLAETNRALAVQRWW